MKGDIIKVMKKEIKKEEDIKKIRPDIMKQAHKMVPIHVFHNQEIDRWIVLMDCKSCQRMHIFYPFN